MATNSDLFDPRLTEEYNEFVLACIDFRDGLFSSANKVDSSLNSDISDMKMNLNDPYKSFEMTGEWFSMSISHSYRSAYFFFIVKISKPIIYH